MRWSSAAMRLQLMRKRIIGDVSGGNFNSNLNWLDLTEVAQVEVTSEETMHPIEDALTPDGKGWRAGSPGQQVVRLLFDEPQALRHIRLLFSEEHQERKQEFALFWSSAQGQPLREIVRQQFQFSPSGAVSELEEYNVSLEGVRILELQINPDRDGGLQHASLVQLLIA